MSRLDQQRTTLCTTFVSYEEEVEGNCSEKCSQYINTASFKLGVSNKVAGMCILLLCMDRSTNTLLC